MRQRECGYRILIGSMLVKNLLKKDFALPEMANCTDTVVE